jgi:hypothetical protein
MYGLKRILSPNSEGGSGAEPNNQESSNNQNNDQTKPEDNNNQESEASENFDNYFSTLLEKEKENQKDDSKPTPEPEKQKKPIFESKTNYDKNETLRVLNENGVKSFEEFAELQKNDFPKFLEIQNNILRNNLQKIQDDKLQELNRKIDQKAIFARCEAEGYPKKEFNSFLLYYGMTPNEKTLELFKKQVSKPNKSEFEKINNLSDMQKNDKKEIKPESTKPTENNYVKKTNDISKLI